MEFSRHPNTKCTEVPKSSISLHPFCDVHSFSNISQPTGLALRIQSFIFLWTPCGLSLWYACWIFSNLHIPPWVEKNYGDHIPSKCSESRHFYSYPTFPLKTPGRIFWKFSPTTERHGANYDLLYQISIRKYEEGLEHLVIYIL